MKDEEDDPDEDALENTWDQPKEKGKACIEPTKWKPEGDLET